jgi:hypothetical protein
MRKSASYSPFQGERLPEVIGQGLGIFRKRLRTNKGSWSFIRASICEKSISKAFFLQILPCFFSAFIKVLKFYSAEYIYLEKENSCLDLEWLSSLVLPINAKFFVHFSIFNLDPFEAGYMVSMQWVRPITHQQPIFAFAAEFGSTGGQY